VTLGTIEGEARERIAKRDTTAMKDTTVKSDIIEAEEKMATEEKRYHFIISIAKIKAIGRTNAPSPSR
jgi:hypothetical protein